MCRKQRLVHAHSEMEHLYYTSLRFIPKEGTKKETCSFSLSRATACVTSTVVSTSMKHMQARSRANLTNCG